jgi:hypothetical protein
MKPSLGKLYPIGDSPEELRRVITEHARRHELALQSFMAIEARLSHLEAQFREFSAVLTEIKSDIAAAKASVKAWFAALTGFWTLMTFVIMVVIQLWLKK